MSESVLELLKAFDLLPEPERHEAASEILKRTLEAGYGPLDDETLAQIADETFLLYDAEEEANGRD